MACLQEKGLATSHFPRLSNALKSGKTYWQDRSIGEITPHDVRHLLQELDNQTTKRENTSKWSYHTVYTYKVLNMLFKYLMTEGFISVNPVAKVSQPKYTPRKPQILNTQDLRKLLQIEGFEDQIGQATVIAFAFALRRGEVLGLPWQDIDFSRKQVHITRQALYLNGKMILADLKMPSSNRTIPLHPFAEKVLLQQRAYIEALKIVAGTCWQENDLVFPSKAGTLWDFSQFDKAFRRRREKLGLSIRFHDIRHTAASWMVSQKGIAAAQKLLGHAQITTTLLYYTHSRKAACLSWMDPSSKTRNATHRKTRQTIQQMSRESIMKRPNLSLANPRQWQLKGLHDTHMGVQVAQPSPCTPIFGGTRPQDAHIQVPPARLERATYGFEVRRSVH